MQFPPAAWWDLYSIKRNPPQRTPHGKEKDMKPPQQITPVGAKTTFVEVWKWGQELEYLHARIAPRFSRPEPRRRVLAYLKGIFSSLERTNGWHPAKPPRAPPPDTLPPSLHTPPRHT